ncbi:MAG: hoxY, partial [Planctomycetaceae bacterium]|nr:hoxY [Planctomycetaceae bacterium]
GCGAICPAYDRGCYGCFGPVKQGNFASLGDHLITAGSSPRELVPLFRNFNGYSPEFRAESDRLARRAAEESHSHV